MQNWSISVDIRMKSRRYLDNRSYLLRSQVTPHCVAGCINDSLLQRFWRRFAFAFINATSCVVGALEAARTHSRKCFMDIRRICNASVEYTAWNIWKTKKMFRGWCRTHLRLIWETSKMKYNIEQNWEGTERKGKWQRKRTSVKTETVSDLHLWMSWPNTFMTL